MLSPVKRNLNGWRRMIKDPEKGSRDVYLLPEFVVFMQNQQNGMHPYVPKFQTVHLFPGYRFPGSSYQ